MNKGFALILVIFLLAACSLVAVVAFSLLAQGTTSGQGLAESMQAYAIAVGGKERYLQQLAGDSDWTDETDQTDIALGAGSFDIAVNSASANRASFTVIGFAPGYLDQTVQRQISLAAIKLPKACRFAVFWQEDSPGQKLTLDTKKGGTQISGDFWSVGSIEIKLPSAVTDGTVYYGAGETVTTDVADLAIQEVQEPFPAMPIIDVTYYDDLMNEYDSAIEANESTNTEFQSIDVPLTGDLLLFEDFKTQGNMNITGWGRIVAWNDVLLHNKGDTGTLTITPDPEKTIEILAGRDFRINKNKGNRIVNINPGTVMYARNIDDANPTNTGKKFEIVQNNKDPAYYTFITGALMLARRKLKVDKGASVAESVLYVDYNLTSDTNNILEIKERGTQGDYTVSGVVISRGRADPSLKIDKATVTGLVYQYGYPSGSPTAGEGLAEIKGDANITGTLLARQFKRNKLGPATITYDLEAVLDALPQGWDGYVMTEPNSWDDN